MGDRTPLESPAKSGDWWTRRTVTPGSARTARERLDDLVGKGRKNTDTWRATSPPEWSQWSGRTRNPSRCDTPSSTSSFCLEPIEDRPDKPPQETCSFCNRKPSNVVCRACGHAFQGRVRLQCSVHPEIIHLMDYSCCPECRNSMLKEYLPEALATKFSTACS